MESFQEKEITLNFSKYKVFAEYLLRKLNSMNVFVCLYLQIIWIIFVKPKFYRTIRDFFSDSSYLVLCKYREKQVLCANISSYLYYTIKIKDKQNQISSGWQIIFVLKSRFNFLI